MMFASLGVVARTAWNKGSDTALDIWKVHNKFYHWYNLSFSSYKMEIILFNLRGYESIDPYNLLKIYLHLYRKHLDF